MALLLWFLFAGHSFAANSTALVDWQPERNSRSTWDIVWACFSTILACTWTVIHSDVPQRNTSDAQIAIRFLRTYSLALFVPEVIFILAMSQFLQARSLRASCNTAQKRRENGAAEPKTWYSTDNRPLERARGLDLDLARSSPVGTEWTLRQAFCVNAGGLALQTQDEWIYTVKQASDISLLIQASILSSSDLRKRDIADRSKADSFAKAFTIVQVTWFLCSVITRWAYGLPVSPLELATVAYVAVGVATYASWWYKPKDMATAMIVSLRYDRKDIPSDVRDIIEVDPTRWVHLRAHVKEDDIASVFWRALKRPFLSSLGDSYEAVEEPVARPSDSIIVLSVCGVIALIFSGVHIAAWNFTFPTRAEWIAWFVFSFLSIALVFVFFVVDVTWQTFKIRRFGDELSSHVAASMRVEHKLIMYAKQMILYLFIAVRLGLLALVFSSLRALPEACYTSVEWVTSIPHV